MLDEVAAVHELNFQIAIGKRIGEALVHGYRGLRRSAVSETRERHVGRGVRRPGKTSERTGASAGEKQAQNSLHLFPPLLLSTQCCRGRRWCRLQRGRSTQ